MTRVFGLAGWSGAGKTTLLKRLIPCLIGQGLRVSTIKHAHHDFDVDQSGKDSYEHRQAGAEEVLVASSRRWALMHELRDASEPSLVELLAKLAPVDLVLVEGFKRDTHPKLEIYRGGAGKPSLHAGDPTILGLATDTAFPEFAGAVFALDDVEAIAVFIRDHAVNFDPA